jgi:hypothetical protein
VTLPVMSYRKWARILRTGGAVYVGVDGQNHHIWEFQPAGADRMATAGIPAHNEGADVNNVYINALRRLWRLRPADGVTDHDFLAGKWR